MTNVATVFNEVEERLANIARGLSIKAGLIDKNCVGNKIGWDGESVEQAGRCGK